jgi:phosphatidylserine/phosphatidylglycerophosphate/cardiolipin synthase-like enzyme
VSRTRSLCALQAVDGSRAYIGSTNMTGRALAGFNLELGVLVTGPQVAHIETVIDSIAGRRIALADTQ